MAAASGSYPAPTRLGRERTRRASAFNHEIERDTGTGQPRRTPVTAASPDVIANSRAAHSITALSASVVAGLLQQASFARQHWTIYKLTAYDAPKQAGAEQ